MAFWISKLLALSAILAFEPFVASNETSAQPINFGDGKTSLLAKLLPVSFHSPLHGLSHCHGFPSRQTKASNLAEGVMQRSPAPVGSNANRQVALQGNLGKRNHIVARGKTPAHTVPQEAVIPEMVIVIVAENVEHHPLPQLSCIFPWGRSEETQL